ncbi:MAG: NADH dehydrogenase subunit, partial [Candidatus Wallbacteria bacterium]|nr:NADH dehydrogenase subunit [Candidatus Wallbacteria bacterium]
IEPHLAMRNLGFHEVGQRMILGTQFCCECNLCTLYACPEDLDPRNACVQGKKELRAAGMSWPKEELGPQSSVTHPMESYRHIPLGKLMLKLGIDRFVNKGPLIEESVRSASFTVPLQQHVGVPAVAAVTAGQRVQEGDVLGSIPAGKLGAPIHAPVAGTVQAAGGPIVIVPS